MSEHDEELEAHEPGTAEPEEDGFLDKLRGGGMGTEDPTIVGDAGPTDIPPGTDGDARLVSTDEPVDHLEI